MRNVFFTFSLLVLSSSIVYAYPDNSGKADGAVLHVAARHPSYNVEVRPAPPPPPPHRYDDDRRPPRHEVDRRPAPPPRHEIDRRPAPPPHHTKPAKRPKPTYNIEVRPAPPPPPR